MSRITKYILPVLVFLSVQGFGQTQKNPFELLHRKPNAPTFHPVDTSRLNDSLADVDSSAFTIPADVNPDTAKTLVILDTVTDTPPENIDLSTMIDQSELQVSVDEPNQDTVESVSSINPFDLQETPPEVIPDTISEDTSTIIEKELGSEQNKITPSHELRTNQSERAKISGAFLALIFLGIFLLLTIIVNINRSLLNKIYRASLNENYSALLYRERKHSSLNYLYSIAYVIFFINVGLFIYLVQFLGEPGVDIFPLWLSILVPIGIYVSRHLIMRVLAHVFPITKEVNQFNFNIVVFNIMIGLILIPINLFLAYGPSVLHLPILYGTIFILGGLYLFRQLRGVLISSSIISTNIFLFFIYLCTVEILPIAVLLKILV